MKSIESGPKTRRSHEPPCSALRSRLTSQRWTAKSANISVAAARWMNPADSKPPSRRERNAAQLVYENFRVMPVSASEMKLTIISP